jgi:hypothetical protein
MPACASSGVYAPRDTHRCDAAVLVRHHVARFLERVEEGSHAPLPDFVQAELRGFAVCGDFSQGFVRTACRRCGDELRVPFPCKGRGFCPSCMGRRMAEGAALLVDHVLPEVGYRQWVLSFTGPMAVRLGYDRELLAAVSGRLARAVLQDMRRAVKREHGLASVAPLHGGVVTVVQRFRSDLGLYVHLHLLVTDGAFEERGDELPFRPAPPPTPARMTAILGRVHEVLAAAGQGADDDLDLDPALAACVQHSLRGPHFAAGAPDTEPPPHTVSAYGLHLHAATTVDGRDRRRLERVCRYLLRPPFAHDAIEALADGRVRVHLKSPSRRGVAFADMSVDTFLSRLCALVPPPRFHMTRYYGVFASHHRLRARVVPTSPQPPAPTQLSLLFAPGLPDELREATSTPRRYGWASLLARVFAVDVTVCSKCGGKMRIHEVVTDPEAIAELLYGARAPPRLSSPGQLGLFG